MYAAYLQSAESDREVYIQSHKEAENNDCKLCKLKKYGYGFTDASLQSLVSFSLGITIKNELSAVMFSCSLGISKVLMLFIYDAC